MNNILIIRTGDSNGPTAAAPGPKDQLARKDLPLCVDCASMIGIKKALLTVPVRNSDRREFIRLHASADDRFRHGGVGGQRRPEIINIEVWHVSISKQNHITVVRENINGGF